jgi:hypothetical protein
MEHNLHLLNLDGSATIDGLEIKCVPIQRRWKFFLFINKTQSFQILILSHKPFLKKILLKIVPRHLLDGFVACDTSTSFWLNLNQIESTITITKGANHGAFPNL